MAAAALTAYFLRPKDNQDLTTPTFTIAEGPLTIGITSSGSIQSRDKVTLRSELEGNNTIIWVIDEGVNVKAGDLLLEFDSAALVTKRNDQEITAATAEGNLIISEEKLEVTKGDCDANLLEREVALTLAKMSFEKYEKGDYPQQARDYEAAIALADEEMKRALEKLEWSQRLAKEGFLTRTELQADELALRRKEIDLEMARTKMSVLTNYTLLQQRATHETDDVVRVVGVVSVVGVAFGELVQAPELHAVRRRGAEVLAVGGAIRFEVDPPAVGETASVRRRSGSSSRVST